MSVNRAYKELMTIGDQLDNIPKLEKQIEHLKKGYKQVRKENKKLKEEVERSRRWFNHLLKEKEKLEEEMNELKCKYDSERLARSPKLWDQMKKENKELKEEIEKLKEEQFDNMEELAKRDGMCLVDISIFDKLIEKEKQYDELKGL